MVTIVTRAGKGSPLTNNEVDANFNNLNSAVSTAVQTIASADSSVVITGTTAIDLSVPVAASTNNLLVQVRNNTGSTLTKGTVVYIDGAVGQNPTVAKALATSDATSAQTLGMITANLATNTIGNVTVIGLITNIDTSAFTDGAQLYLSGTTAGSYTATKTVAPIHMVYVGVVEHAHPTQGKIFVKIQNGYELDELHNVVATSPSNGQTIVYNTSNSLWETATLPVAGGGTGATTLTGYVKASGTTAMTASATIPSTDISGLGTMSTQNANAVAITGGSVNGTTVGASTASTGSFTSLAYSTTFTGGTGVVALGTDQFYKDASGNIGIGTNSPSTVAAGSKLVVYNAGFAAISIVSNGSSNTQLRFDNTLGAYLNNLSNTPMLFYNNATEKMRLDATGNLGIGIASPVAKLHILDEGSSAFFIDGYSNSSGPIIRTRAARGTLASPTAVTSGTLLGGMRGFGYNGTAFSTTYTGGVNIIAAETFTTIAQGTYVAINTTALGAVATTERMRIDAAGNVGIGNTPSGTYTLEVTGNISASTGFVGAHNGTVGATTPSTGAFTTISATGVITSTQATGTAPFTVASTTNVVNLNASSLNGATFAAPGAIGGGTAAAGTFTSLSYSTTLTGGTGIVNLGSGQFYKDASGNVGIGTASPVASTTSKLFISGDLTLISSGSNIVGSNIYYHTVNGWTTAAAGYGSAIRGDNTAGGLGFWTSSASTGANTVSPTFAQQMLLDANGNLGIGNTPSGTYALEVTGTVNATLIAATRINPRIGTVASGATITPTSDASDQYNVTALAVAATIAVPSGTPVNGQRLTLRIKDNGTARALTWTTSAGGYRIVGTTLPTTTVISKTVYIGCVYNAADSFWDVIAVAQQA
jgi:hypothetical protein